MNVNALSRPGRKSLKSAYLLGFSLLLGSAVSGATPPWDVVGTGAPGAIYDLSLGSQVWAVGEGGYIARIEGDKVLSIPGPSHEHLFGVAFTDADTGWAVGANGTLLAYRNKSWTALPPPVRWNLMSVSFASREIGWAVGEHGTLLGFDGTSWSSAVSPVNTLLSRVTLVDATHGWAVGNEGSILAYDGRTWRRVESPTKANLYGVGFSSLSNGWAAGADGTLLHYDGKSWSLDKGPAESTWIDLVIAPDSQLVLVGRGGHAWKSHAAGWEDLGPVASARVLFRILASARGELWAVGSRPEIYREIRPERPRN